MKESTDKSTILSETAVFEFVAGKLSKEKQSKFEELIKQDDQLRQEVEIERELRKALAESRECEPVTMSNFDDLLSQIDALENPKMETPASNNITQLNAQVNSESSTNTNRDNIVSLPKTRTRQFSIAASIAAVGMVFAAFMSSGYLDHNRQQEDAGFTLLSSAKQVDFLALSDQGRVAKLVLTEGVANVDLTELLLSYQLQRFEQGGAAADTLYVYTEQAITEQQLATWKADKRIQQVAVFSPNVVEE